LLQMRVTSGLGAVTYVSHTKICFHNTQMGFNHFRSFHIKTNALLINEVCTLLLMHFKFKHSDV